MRAFKHAILVTTLFLGSVLAQTTTSGVVSNLVYNGSGQVTKFDCDGKTFTLETPSDRWTDNLQRWKDGAIRINITDQDSDKVIETNDTVKEA